MLGGGASLGSVQVGMLQGLSEHDLVASTAVGCLSSAVLARDLDVGRHAAVARVGATSDRSMQVASTSTDSC